MLEESIPSLKGLSVKNGFVFESSFGVEVDVEVDVVVLSVFAAGFLDSSNVSLTVVSLTLTMI